MQCICFRAEVLALRTWPGRTKVLGAVLCVGGTMVVSLLKGPLLHLWHTIHADAKAPAPAAAASPGGGSSSHHGMVTGTLFLSGSCLSYAFWLIVQVSTVLYNTSGSVSSCRFQPRLVSEHLHCLNCRQGLRRCSHPDIG